jgi:hypothetical protein
MTLGDLAGLPPLMASCPHCEQTSTRARDAAVAPICPQLGQTIRVSMSVTIARAADKQQPSRTGSATHRDSQIQKAPAMGVTGAKLISPCGDCRCEKISLEDEHPHPLPASWRIVGNKTAISNKTAARYEHGFQNLKNVAMLNRERT